MRVAALAGVRWYWELGDHLSLAAAFEYLAVYGEAGNPTAQVQWCAAAYALRQSLGAPAPVGELEDVQRQLAFARAELGDTAFQTVWAESCATSVEQLVYAALNGSPPATPRPHGRGESPRAPYPGETGPAIARSGDPPGGRRRSSGNLHPSADQEHIARAYSDVR